MPRNRAMPRHRSFRRPACAAALFLVAGAASAADWRLGLAGGAAHGGTDCVAGFDCDPGAGYGKLFGALALGHDLDLQLAWLDAGPFQGGDTTPAGTAFGGDFRVTGFALSAAYRWSFAPGWTLEGRAGAASLRTRFSYAAPLAGSASKTTTQPIVGASLGWAPAPHWRLALDLDATRFEAYRTHGPLRLAGVAAEYSF